jgi:hypothetical protein
LVLFVLASCSSQESEQRSLSTSVSSLSRFKTLDIVTGQTLFIPAYKELFVGRVRVVNLQTTVSIFNADTDAAIIIKSVRYYDTDGQLVKEYIEEPLQLAPVASTAFKAESVEKQGSGVGANFIVEWVAEQPVHEPVIEAVIIGGIGNHGISLISPGRVISRQSP